MATYQGEAVAAYAQVKHPITEELLTDLTGEAHFFAPGKDPKNSPTDRAAPDEGPFAMVYDAAAEGYIAVVSTDGWTPGKWTAQTRVYGNGWDNWEYATVTVKP